jgi:hypothetical protein
MARKSNLSNVILTYIARDDSAIGVPPEELDDKYGEYIRTKDMSLLQIDHSKQPCIYTLRTFSTQRHSVYVTKAVEALAPVAERMKDAGKDAEELPKDLDFETLSKAWDEYDSYAALAIRDRVIGCSGHPMVSEVTDTGELKEVVVNWQPGQPEPKGVVDDILGQKELVREIFSFLVTAASLTERQKKA